MIVLDKIFWFFRRWTQCSRGIHYRMQYDSGDPNDITRAGTCSDCGHNQDGITWSRMPTVKPPKLPDPHWKTMTNNLEEISVLLAVVREQFEQIRQLTNEMYRYKIALTKIVCVNAMDYEYKAWAKEALRDKGKP